MRSDSKNVSRRVETYPVFGECMVCGGGHRH